MPREEPIPHEIIIRPVPKALKKQLPTHLFEIEPSGKLPSEEEFASNHRNSGYHRESGYGYFTQNHHVGTRVAGPFIVNGPLDNKHTWIDSEHGEGKAKRPIAALVSIPHPQDPETRINLAYLGKMRLAEGKFLEI